MPEGQVQAAQGDKAPEAPPPQDAPPPTSNQQVDRAGDKSASSPPPESKNTDTSEGPDNKTDNNKESKENKTETSSEKNVSNNDIDRRGQNQPEATDDQTKQTQKDKSTSKAIMDEADAVLHSGKLGLGSIGGDSGEGDSSDKPQLIHMADNDPSTKMNGQDMAADQPKEQGSDENDDPKKGREKAAEKNKDAGTNGYDKSTETHDKDAGQSNDNDAGQNQTDAKNNDAGSDKKKIGDDKKDQKKPVDRLSLDPEAHDKSSVEEAFKQLKRWRNADGTAIHEKDNTTVLKEYYRNAGKSEKESARLASGGKGAWSGATISTIETNSAGGGHFPASAKHSVYTNACKRNAESGEKGQEPGISNPYWAHDAATTKPAVGDIIVRQREGGEHETFSKLNSDSRLHGEKVVEVGEDYVKVISGNASHKSPKSGDGVGNTMSDPQIRKLDSDGHLLPYGKHQFKYVAVIHFENLAEKRKNTTAK